MKFIPLKQTDEDACGPTCIEMTARYFGLPFTTEQISELSQYKEKEGLSNKDLVAALEKMGLTVDVKSDVIWDDLVARNTSDCAIIVSWMLDGYIGHFSLVDQADADHVYLVDPYVGEIRKLEKIHFMRLWLDYDELWYPEKSTDIQLRWMAVVSKNKADL